MADKEPLLTRSKIREMKKKERKLDHSRAKKLEKEYEIKAKEIKKEYSTKRKQQKTVNGSRAALTEKMTERSSFLNKAIVIVVILLIIVAIAVFKW